MLKEYHTNKCKAARTTLVEGLPNSLSIRLEKLNIEMETFDAKVVSIEKSHSIFSKDRHSLYLELKELGTELDALEREILDHIQYTAKVREHGNTMSYGMEAIRWNFERISRITRLTIDNIPSA